MGSQIPYCWKHIHLNYSNASILLQSISFILFHSAREELVITFFYVVWGIALKYNYVFESSILKKTYGLMLPGAGWQTCRWRICGRKVEYYTHTQVYLKYEQNLFFIQNSCVRLQVTKRDCTAMQTLHYEFCFLCFVVFTIGILNLDLITWNKNRVLKKKVQQSVKVSRT